MGRRADSLTSQRSGTSDIDDDLVAATIDRLLSRRAPGATICPSDVARALWPDEVAWRAAMPTIRRVAASMVRAGALVATRGGREVDAEAAGGPIRLGKPR